MLQLLGEWTNPGRPYTILYLIPVAIGAALLGTRGGLISALFAIMLARVYLMNDHKHGVELLFLLKPSDNIEFASLAAGTLTVAIVTGRLRTTLSQLRESEQLRRVFSRDVLLAVSGGKLRLLEPTEMPPADLVSGSPMRSMPLQKPEDATKLRAAVQKIGETHGLNAERLADLAIGVTEAATNAIKHGHGGHADIWATPDAVSVAVQDHGTGIAPAHLARATLEAGYSTRVSLGMGFFLMLQAADALALCTGDQGTTVLLHVANRPSVSEEELLMARYVLP